MHRYRSIKFAEPEDGQSSVEELEPVSVD